MALGAPPAYAAVSETLAPHARRRALRRPGGAPWGTLELGAGGLAVVDLEGRVRVEVVHLEDGAAVPAGAHAILLDGEPAFAVRLLELDGTPVAPRVYLTP